MRLRCCCSVGEEVGDGEAVAEVDLLRVAVPVGLAVPVAETEGVLVFVCESVVVAVLVGVLEGVRLAVLDGDLLALGLVLTVADGLGLVDAVRLGEEVEVSEGANSSQILHKKKQCPLYHYAKKRHSV